MLAENWLLGMLRRISLPSVTDAVSVDLTSTVGDWAMTVTCSSDRRRFHDQVRFSVTVVFSRMFS